jgi:hypothetical protein
MSSLFTNLTKSIIDKYPDFGDYEVKCLNNEEKKYVIEIAKLGMYIFDYSPSEFTVDKQIKFTRSNFSAFMNKNLVEDFAKEIIKQNLLIGTHDHKNGKVLIFKNGTFEKWSDNIDFTTTFQISFGKYGNPSLKNIEHVSNYEGDINMFKNIINDEQLINYLLDNFIEISVVNKSFSDETSVVKLSLDALTKILNKNFI